MTAPRSKPPSRRVARTGIPWPALVLAAGATALFALPLLGLVWRAPWSDIGTMLGRDTVRQALWLSLRTSAIATVVATVLGVPLAWALAQVDFPGRNIVRALATLSMVLPPVVGGVALFASFGRRGIIGQFLDDWFGVRLPFTTAGVVLAQTFVAMPFLVLTIESALRQVDHRVEEAARTLGADRWYVFIHVTVPTIRPALVAGAVLAWARALGEFGATITFAGNFPGTTRTLPLATYLALENDPDEAVLISLVLVAVSFTVLVTLRERWLGGERGPGT